MGTSDQIPAYQYTPGELVEHIATEKLSWNTDVVAIREAMNAEESALEAFIQFMTQRSIQRPYAKRVAFDQYEVSRAAVALVDKFLEAHVAKLTERKPDLFTSIGLPRPTFPGLRGEG